jgi:hypothetical protein
MKGLTLERLKNKLAESNSHLSTSEATLYDVLEQSACDAYASDAIPQDHMILLLRQLGKAEAGRDGGAADGLSSSSPPAESMTTVSSVPTTHRGKV